MFSRSFLVGIVVSFSSVVCLVIVGLTVADENPFDPPRQPREVRTESDEQGGKYFGR